METKSKQRNENLFKEECNLKVVSQWIQLAEVGVLQCYGILRIKLKSTIIQEGISESGFKRLPTIEDGSSQVLMANPTQAEDKKARN